MTKNEDLGSIACPNPMSCIKDEIWYTCPKCVQLFEFYSIYNKEYFTTLDDKKGIFEHECGCRMCIR